MGWASNVLQNPEVINLRQSFISLLRNITLTVLLSADDDDDGDYDMDGALYSIQLSCKCKFIYSQRDCLLWQNLDSAREEYEKVENYLTETDATTVVTR